MANEEIKVGDVVQLKAGGPPITVAEIDEDEARCVWIDDKGKQQEEYYPLITLTKHIKENKGNYSPIHTG